MPCEGKHKNSNLSISRPPVTVDYVATEAIKEIDPTNLAIVVLLPFVSEHRANDDARIFDNHLPRFDVPLAKETTAVDSRPASDAQVEDKVVCCYANSGDMSHGTERYSVSIKMQTNLISRV